MPTETNKRVVKNAITLIIRRLTKNMDSKEDFEVFYVSYMAERTPPVNEHPELLHNPIDMSLSVNNIHITIPKIPIELNFMA